MPLAGVKGEEGVDRPNSARRVADNENRGAKEVERLRRYLLVGLKG
jgi:hypothetical protein